MELYIISRISRVTVKIKALKKVEMCRVKVFMVNLIVLGTIMNRRYKLSN